MAKKTLRKGDNHKKKTRSKRGKRGGKPPTLKDIATGAYQRYKNDIYRPAHKYFTGRISTGAYNDNMAKQAESDARKMKEMEERKRKQEEREEREKENYNNIFMKDTNLNIINERVLYNMRDKLKSERTTDEQNIIDNGNFYRYNNLYEREDLGKVKDIGYLEDTLIRAHGDRPPDNINFYKDGKWNVVIVDDDRELYYTLDKPIEKSNEEQPGGNRKKKTRSKRTKRGTKRATK